MLGRLARYLRFVGCDTVYARGWSDEEIESRARSEGRIVVTRDRALAARAQTALLLTSPHLADQWRSVRRAYPEVPNAPRFERCSECNGRLERVLATPEVPRTPGIPWDRIDRGLALYRCVECAHCYWEGSHVASIRERLASWAREGPP